MPRQLLPARLLIAPPSLLPSVPPIFVYTPLSRDDLGKSVPSPLGSLRNRATLPSPSLDFDRGAFERNIAFRFVSFYAGGSNRTRSFLNSFRRERTSERKAGEKELSNFWRFFFFFFFSLFFFLFFFPLSFIHFFRDAIFVTFTNLATSIFAGFVIFSIMGFLARQMGVSVEEVIQSGAALAFIAYPEAVVRMPLPNVWAVLFFVMLFILGIGSQVSERLINERVTGRIRSRIGFITNKKEIIIGARVLFLRFFFFFFFFSLRKNFF